MPEGPPTPDLESENARLREENARLRAEVAKLKEELISLKTTVSAVVARSIDAKASYTGRRRYKKPGRRDGHQGASRARPEKIDATVELDQSDLPQVRRVALGEADRLVHQGRRGHRPREGSWSRSTW